MIYVPFSPKAVKGRKDNITGLMKVRPHMPLPLEISKNKFRHYKSGSC